ncbi:MAG: FAD-dependent oxidoreductase [Nitriliruptorales bacterium]|nr:FAD-dependent oxidoreductase [Nitriliruptorales bacterium]
MTDTALLVLGAGPAGLGAAFRAARAGHDVTVLEREARVGGAAGSFEVAGLRVDHGSHRLHHAIDARILADLHGLLGSDLQSRERRGRIRLADAWVDFPPSPVNLAASLPPGFVASLARDAVAAPFRQPDADTFAEQIRAGLGPTMLDRFYGPYARKLWGRPPEELAGEQARVRVGANSVRSILRRVVGASQAARSRFLYPRRGFGQISEALAGAATDAGADIVLDTPARSLRPEGDGIVVTTDDGEITASRVWSTIPLPLLARLWATTPPAVQEHATALDTRAMVLIYVVLSQPRYTGYDAHYLPELWTPVTRISEPKNYRDSDEDPASLTVLCAELPCQVGDDHWAATPDELGAVVVSALRRAELPDPHVARVEVRRLPSAYPVYDRGYATHVDALEAWAGGIDRLLTFGRQGLFVHDNSHHALAMAYAAVDALSAEGGFDRTAWARARESFRSHTVED